MKNTELTKGFKRSIINGFIQTDASNEEVLILDRILKKCFYLDELIEAISNNDSLPTEKRKELIKSINTRFSNE